MGPLLGIAPPTCLCLRALGPKAAPSPAPPLLCQLPPSRKHCLTSDIGEANSWPRSMVRVLTGVICFSDCLAGIDYWGRRGQGKPPASVSDNNAVRVVDIPEPAVHIVPPNPPVSKNPAADLFIHLNGSLPGNSDPAARGGSLLVLGGSPSS